MNANKGTVAQVGLVAGSVLVVALTGCRTYVVHEHARTVYTPAPPPVVYSPPPVAEVQAPEPAPVVVIQSENDFYEPLANYGRWVVVGSYGRCWVPARAEAGWQPYSNGYWQRTDAGWYWASDEPWGWATYHYGRWDFSAEFGWFWVPQTQWAPAWVCWREGGDYVGWAPLRPSVTIGVSLGAVNYEPAFASRAFVFVEHRRMLEPVRPRTVIVNNTTIINQTVNITNVKIVNKTVINEGPRVEVIEHASGHKVQTVPVHEFRHREETAVAARERNIPMRRERSVPPPARVEAPPASQPLPAPVVSPRDGRAIGHPAEVVTQPAQPALAPARPTPPHQELEKPAREERKPEVEVGRKITSTPPAAEPQPKPDGRFERAVPPHREARPTETPAVTTKPAPQPDTALPGRPGRQHEPAVERPGMRTPPVVESKPQREARPEARPKMKPSVKPEREPTETGRTQGAPPAGRQIEKPLVSPREKSRASEPGEANKPKQEGKGAKKHGDESEAPDSKGQPR